MKLPRNNLTKRSSTATNIIAQAVFATQNNHQRERSQIVQIDTGYLLRLPSVSHFQSVAYALEQVVRRNKRIFAVAQASHNPSKRPYAGGIKVDKDLHRRNPNISVCEMYTKLREKHAYSRHPGSLYRVFVQLGYRKSVESTKKKSKHNGHYDTPTELGVKWQMDVK